MLKNQLVFFLIDDDDDDRELFEWALDDVDPGIRYSCAAGCGEALHVLKSKSELPDIIFLDLNMPQVSGRDCLKELKQTAGLAHIPVIIFSTSADPRDIEETKKMGAVDFVIKPPRTSELTVILKRIIAEHIMKEQTT